MKIVPDSILVGEDDRGLKVIGEPTREIMERASHPDVVKFVPESKMEEEIAKIREERASDIADALLALIKENKEPRPHGQSFFASAIYELAVAYGEQKHGWRRAESRINAALEFCEEGDVKAMIFQLTKKEK
jgi:hypothetical protein